MLFLAPVSALFSQVYLPGPHAQKHELPRGAYVACVDDITQDMVAGSNGKYQQLVEMVSRHDLQFLAFYGLHHIVDNNPLDNPEEAQLRQILSGLRSQFPDLRIGAVGGGIQNPTAGKISAQHFEQLKTGNFIFQPISSEACPNETHSTWSLAALNRRLNPHNPNPTESYQAEVMKFFARIASTYGFASSNNNLNSGDKSAKNNSQAQDFFDHLVLEDEWWWRSGSIRSNLTDHEDLLIAMRSILHLSHACEAKVITYESIQPDTSGQTPMQVQATEIAALADRVFITHYFKCVPNVLERYCLPIEAWGASSALGTEFWPLFSAEDQSARVSCSRFDPSESWNDFWGEWMDTNYTASNAPLDLCPGPGRAGYGYPYEADEAEDLYLERLDSASLFNSLPGSSCTQFDIGDYRPEGFMWFTAHLMHAHGRSHVSLDEDLFLQEPQLYPNPAQDFLHLNYGEIRSIQGLAGERYEIQSLGDGYDISMLSKGVYIAVVNHQDETFYLKFLRE